jgi:hypothetical protein
MTQDLPEPAIEVTRPHYKLADRLTAYTVWLDHQDAGAIRDGETRRFPVTPGVHHMQLGVAGRWLGSGRIWTSPIENVDARPGEQVSLTCSPSPVAGIVRIRHRINLRAPSPERLVS